MQCTPELKKSEEETSETERSRISVESKNEARRKSQSYIRHNCYSLYLTTKLKQRNYLIKANTLLSVTEIGGRIAIKHSKEFPRTLNSLRSLHKVDLWLL